MDTTREVEVLHGESGLSWPEHPGFRGRLDTMKSDLATRAQGLRRSVAETRVAIRDGAETRVAGMQTSMRSNPMMWAAVAAGTGFAVGLIARVAQSRRRQRHPIPEIIIIEASY